MKVTSKDIKENRRMCKEFYSRVVSMKFSHYVSAFCINNGIKPNTITAMMLYSAIFCSFLLLNEEPIFQILGALLLLSVNIFDTSDGEVARYTKNTSSVGVYYDKLYQIIVDILIFLIILYNQYIYFERIIYLIPSLLFLLFYIIDNYSKVVYTILNNKNKKEVVISYDKTSKLQYFVHITSSNTGFFHLYWIFLLADYIFNTEHIIQFIFITYFMILQIVKTIARQLQIINSLKAHSENM